MAQRLSWALAREPLIFAIAASAIVGFWLAHCGELGRALRAFARVRAGLLGVVLVRAAILMLCGTAWRIVVRRLSTLPLRLFQGLRFIREGINVLLPVAAIGGDLVGMRLITFWNLPGGAAAASVGVDVLLQAAAQAAFTLLGVALLVWSSGIGSLGISMLVGVAALLTALAAFWYVQRRGMRPVERLLKRFVTHEGTPGDGGLRACASSGLEAALTTIWQDRRAVASAAGLHFGAWLLGTLEIWIALDYMGQGHGWEVALILESLSQGARSMAFPIPAGIGVQEGGLIAAGQLFGIHPGVALAISMVKRVADLAVGVPALGAWVILEARHTGRRLSEPLGAKDL